MLLWSRRSGLFRLRRGRYALMGSEKAGYVLARRSTMSRCAIWDGNSVSQYYDTLCALETTFTRSAAILTTPPWICADSSSLCCCTIFNADHCNPFEHHPQHRHEQFVLRTPVAKIQSKGQSCVRPDPYKVPYLRQLLIFPPHTLPNVRASRRGGRGIV